MQQYQGTICVSVGSLTGLGEGDRNVLLYYITTRELGEEVRTYVRTSQKFCMCARFCFLIVFSVPKNLHRNGITEVVREHLYAASDLRAYICSLLATLAPTS